MAAGYALGPLFKLDAGTRVQWLVLLGVAVTVRLRRCCARPTSTAIRQPWVAHESCARDLALVHQLREISALAALPDDDARAGPAAARGLRERARAARRLRSSTFGRVPFALLHRAHLPDPRAGGALSPGRPAATSLAVRRVPAGEARRLRARPRRASMRCGSRCWSCSIRSAAGSRRSSSAATTGG